jgi:hypothetical protein
VRDCHCATTSLSTDKAATHPKLGDTAGGHLENGNDGANNHVNVERGVAGTNVFRQVRRTLARFGRAVCGTHVRRVEYARGEFARIFGRVAVVVGDLSHVKENWLVAYSSHNRDQRPLLPPVFAPAGLSPTHPSHIHQHLLVACFDSLADEVTHGTDNAGGGRAVNTAAQRQKEATLGKKESKKRVGLFSSMSSALCTAYYRWCIMTIRIPTNPERRK